MFTLLLRVVIVFVHKVGVVPDFFLLKYLVVLNKTFIFVVNIKTYNIMNTVKFKFLKWGIFSRPTNEKTFERYVIENKEDLKGFSKQFPEVKKGEVYNSIINCLSDGNVVLFTDRHPKSGFPTWCIESKNSNHPTSIVRVKL